MESATPKKLLDKSRLRIAAKVRELRLARRWTQPELAAHLGVSPSRLSEVERGSGSFTAEQFLTVLSLFNVTTGYFAKANERPSELQNALARRGAAHLLENDSVVPNEDLDNVDRVVKEAILDGSPRFITALAPVLVRNIESVHLGRLHLELTSLGMERRLAWVVENTLWAVERVLTVRSTIDRSWSRHLRRTVPTLGVFLDTFKVVDGQRDVLDTTIRSKKSLEEVSRAASEISHRWGIVTTLQPDDFLQMLRAAIVDD